MSAGTTSTLVFIITAITSSAGYLQEPTAATNVHGYIYPESYQARRMVPGKVQLTDKIDSADIWVTTTAGNKKWAPMAYYRPWCPWQAVQEQQIAGTPDTR